MLGRKELFHCFKVSLTKAIYLEEGLNEHIFITLFHGFGQLDEVLGLVQSEFTQAVCVHANRGGNLLLRFSQIVFPVFFVYDRTLVAR